MAQRWPPYLQSPSFCTWINWIILLVPELSFSFHICCLQIFLSPPPFLNAKGWTASPFLRATITAGRGEQQTPILSWTLPSCPRHRLHQVQRVISHLLTPCRRARRGLDPSPSEQRRSLVASTASGIWDPTRHRMATNAALVGSRAGPTAPWFHQEIFDWRQVLPAISYLHPIVSGIQFKTILLDFLLLSLSLLPLFPVPLCHDANALLVQDPSIVWKATGSSSHLLLVSLWIFKYILHILNQSFM